MQIIVEFALKSDNFLRMLLLTKAQDKYFGYFLKQII